jgi:transposase
MFYYLRDRKSEHPQAHLAGYAGIQQADAYDGYNQLYLAGSNPGLIREAACWSHARRPFFAMTDIEENARRKAACKKGNRALPGRDRGRATYRCAGRDRALHQ